MIADLVARATASADVPVVRSHVCGLPDGVPAAEELLDVVDPATSRVIARIADAGAPVVERAVAAGLEAFPAWRRTAARDRAAMVHRLADRIEQHTEELARLDTTDTGNPLEAMRQDIAKGLRLMREAASLALQTTGVTFPLPGLHYTVREPWGVVARVITFNHPAMFACARLGSALVTGNCVVLKPSELAPLSTVAIAELADGIVPPGTLSVVVGGPATGAALVSHPSVRRISFTGGTATALRIQAVAAASGHVKTLTFELGGKNPIVVFPDVDLDEVSAAIVRGMNFSRVQGQSCGSTSRLLVHDSIAAEVLERVAAQAERIRTGMPMEPTTQMGAMITRAARDRCLAAVGRARERGARVVTGGVAPPDPALADGAFLRPTVVDRVEPGTELADEEIFGPVLAAMTWRTEAEALELANTGRYGLTAAIWTRDLDRALRFADGIEAGYVWVNDVETRYPTVPFGGWNDSGVGVENGVEELMSFTRIKAVNIRVR